MSSNSRNKNNLGMDLKQEVMIFDWRLPVHTIIPLIDKPKRNVISDLICNGQSSYFVQYNSF